MVSHTVVFTMVLDSLLFPLAPDCVACSLLVPMHKNSMVTMDMHTR